MIISINNNDVEFSSDDLTIAELIEQQRISKSGTAIAVNDKIVRHDQWDSFRLKDCDRLTVISAAFGG